MKTIFYYKGLSSPLEVYRKDLILHHENGPALIKLDEKLKIIEEVFYINGMIDRKDGLPAQIVYKHSLPDSLAWFKDGKKIRDIIHYRESNGDIIKKESYYVNAMRHRENGPAIIYYEINNKVEIKTDEHWYLEGKKV